MIALASCEYEIIIAFSTPAIMSAYAITDARTYWPRNTPDKHHLHASLSFIARRRRPIFVSVSEAIQNQLRYFNLSVLSRRDSAGQMPTIGNFSADTMPASDADA